MKVVKQISKNKLIFRTQPEFEDGQGIIDANMVLGIDISDLEETVCTLEEWEDAISTFEVDELPRSKHIGKLIAVDTSRKKPATVRRRFLGKNYDVQCLVSDPVKDQYVAGTIQLGDYVAVDFIDEIPNTVERHVAIVAYKVFKSW